jgi:hypothetical protein
MGVKAMLAKFPKAERIFQLRIAGKDGVVTVDGPITTKASQELIKLVLAEESAYPPGVVGIVRETKGKNPKDQRGDDDCG